jgi:hypothetical protein
MAHDNITPREKLAWLKNFGNYFVDNLVVNSECGGQGTGRSRIAAPIVQIF